MAYPSNIRGPKNPNDDRDRGDIFKSLEFFYRTTRWYRIQHTDLIREYAGGLYTDDNKRQQLSNLLLQTAETYVIALAANLPQVGVSTHNPKLRHFARNYKIAINNLIKEIRLDETLQEILLDSFFGPGIAKIYLADAPQIQIEENVWMNPGQPYCDRVSLDRFVWDTHATRFSQIQCAADRYRVPFHHLKDDLYNQEAVAKLQPSSKYEGAYDDQAEDISYGRRGDSDEYTDMIDLMDVWLPEEKLVVTWACDRSFRGTEGKPLVVQDWDGPEDGPYRFLNLGPVPDNTLPTSPASNLKPLHDLANSLLRKLAQQARRQKDLPIYNGSSVDSAKRLKDGSDGEWTRVDDVSQISVLKQGGIDQSNANFFGIVDSLYSSAAGNLKAKAGLGPQAETAKQEQMIASQISTQESGMRVKWLKFVTNIITDLGVLLWKDVVKEMPGTFTLPDSGVAIDASWTPEKREGAFIDYNFDVLPESMAFKSQQQKAAELRQELMEWIPIMPLLQQQGIQIDIKAYMSKMSEYKNLPELQEIFKYDQPIPDTARDSSGANPGGGSPRVMPNSTSREYVRKSVSEEPSMQQMISGMPSGGSPGVQQQGQGVS